MCNANPQSTYALYFEKLDSVAAATTIQFLFHYQHPSGEMRLRVTTIPVNIIADSDNINLELGFDQETALVLVARDSINKLQPGNTKVATTASIVKQLDNTLIDFVLVLQFILLVRLNLLDWHRHFLYSPISLPLKTITIYKCFQQLT